MYFTTTEIVVILNVMIITMQKISQSLSFQTVYFDWDEATQGIILGSFYYGYVLTHIPGGMLAERYGGKWLLGLGLLSTALCTLLTPVVVKAGGAWALIVLRVVEGLGEVCLPIYF